jgi:hypothetical protein
MRERLLRSADPAGRSSLPRVIEETAGAVHFRRWDGAAILRKRELG